MKINGFQEFSQMEIVGLELKARKWTYKSCIVVVHSLRWQTLDVSLQLIFYLFCVSGM